MSESLAEIGEIEILNRLKRFMPLGQIDDDTAEIKTYGKNLILNTDVLVEEVHFSKYTTSPEDVGWRAISTNLSDLASSGVDEIIGVTIGLIAPPSTEWNWVEDVYTGMGKALKIFGGKLLGGDCSKGKQKVLAITAIGTLGSLRMHRSHAIPGDSLIASGPHGLSRLGLALLLSDPIINKSALPIELKSNAIHTHQRPNPPLEALKQLKNCKPKNLPWRVGGTDSSDGLLMALQNLCNSSGCQAVIDPQKLPKVNNWPMGSHWENWCLNGGEDFELVLSLPKEWAQALLKKLPQSQLIGFMKSGPANIIWSDSKKIVKPSMDYKHFKNN